MPLAGITVKVVMALYMSLKYDHDVTSKKANSCPHASSNMISVEIVLVLTCYLMRPPGECQFLSCSEGTVRMCALLKEVQFLTTQL